MDLPDIVDTNNSQVFPTQSISPTASPGDEDTWGDQAAVIFFFGGTFLFIFVFAFCNIRHYCLRMFDSEGNSLLSKICCAGRYSVRRNLESEQYNADLVWAESLQRQINEEERERARLAKRKDRCMWYEYYLKPCTIIVEKSDLFHGEDEESSEEDTMDVNDPIEIGDKTEGEDSSTKLNTDKIEEKSTCTTSDDDDDDENSNLRLKLRSLDRSVEGTCALCIDQYEVGDAVVWSDLMCTHVFHKECLMLWLSKGKKRCPICREWFVPGAKIEDQKLMHGNSWRNALEEMLQREEEEKKQMKESLISCTDDSGSIATGSCSTSRDVNFGDAESHLIRDSENDNRSFALDDSKSEQEENFASQYDSV